MAGEFEPSAVADTLRSHLTGEEPRADLVDLLGGWSAIETLAPALVDDPLLPATLMLLTRGVDMAHDTGTDMKDGAGVDALRPAAAALVDAVVATVDPGLFAATMSTLCSHDALANIVGEQLAAACATLAKPPRVNGAETSEAETLRHAVALESAARLAVLAPKNRYGVLATLTTISEPQPLRYARAVSRTVAVAYDHWNAAEGADDVADVLDILTGVTPAGRPSATPPTGGDAAALSDRDTELRLVIAPDAAWTKAGVDVARALRAQTGPLVVERLDDALESLAVVTTTDSRPDAELLQAALSLLRELLVSLTTGAKTPEAKDWELNVAEVQALAARASDLLVETHGLAHWSGDRKLTVLRSWQRFIADLAFLRDNLDRNSIYQAAVVLDDLLDIYATTNTYDVVSSGPGVENVVRVIRPAITTSFASRNGLLRNLTDHTDALRGRIGAAKAGGSAGNVTPDDDLATLQRRLTTAETVLAATETSLKAAAGPPGKEPEQALELPPLLADLLGREHDVSVADLDLADLLELNAAVADRRAGTDINLDPVLRAVRRDMLTKLSYSPDFSGDVAGAVTAVLDQLIKFIASRQNVQASWRPYLFTPDVEEDDLHQDLFNYLTGGHLSSAISVETQHVGGGRIDLMITFAGFHLYIELKEDDTQVPIDGKVAYLKQTIAYQASGIRIGFLVVLRSKSPKGTSVQPNLRELVTHATIEATPGAPLRHVVMLELPGDRTAPSQMKKA